MPSEIFGERFFGNREPAWHRLGTVIDMPDAKASDAIRIAELDYGVDKVDLFLPNGMASGYSAIIRESTDDDPQPQVFGVARDYELVHINEIAEQLDNFPWPVTSAGALRKGAEIFISYDLGDREMLGEDYRMYLSVAHPYAPGTAWRAMLTPVRVVCQNTLMFGESIARANFVVKHNNGAKARIDDALVVAQAAAMEERALRALEQLKTIKVTKPKLKHVIELTYPLHRIPLFDEGEQKTESEALAKTRAKYERYNENIKALREGASQVYDKFNDEHKAFAGTGYALYQSLVEWSDWRKGNTKDESALAEASVIGNRAKQKELAYKSVLSIAK